MLQLEKMPVLVKYCHYCVLRHQDYCRQVHDWNLLIQPDVNTEMKVLCHLKPEHKKQFVIPCNVDILKMNFNQYSVHFSF